MNRTSSRTFTPQALGPPVLTVSQLTQAIKLSLEATFPTVSVQGEISNFRRQGSGHLYFSLKDKNAQVNAVMFRSNTSRLTVLPKNGDQVTIRGEINIYPPRGSYQIVVRELAMTGAGELLIKLELLKTALREKGWFSPAHKQPLPSSPKRIGIITSPTGAALQDVLNILTRRSGGFHLILSPVRVQGAGAKDEIAQAIADFNRYPGLVDVLIVGRGGGSIEDLWAFNEEVVARTIFESKIPIISAVGHEIDTTLADLVADVRAPTPSAAAELVVAERATQLKQLDQIRTRLTANIIHQLRYRRQRMVDLLRHPLLTSSSHFLGMWMQRVDDFRVQIDQAIRRHLSLYNAQIEGCRHHLTALKSGLHIKPHRLRLQQFNEALIFRIQGILMLYRIRLEKIIKVLASNDPNSRLQRGYSMLFSEKDSSLIKSIRQLAKGDLLKIQLSDGEVSAQVTKIQPKMES